MLIANINCRKGRGGVKKRKKAAVNPQVHGQFTNFSAPMMFANSGPTPYSGMTYNQPNIGVVRPTSVYAGGQMASGAQMTGFVQYPPQMTMGAPRVNVPPSGRMVGSSPHLQRHMMSGPQAVNHQQHNQVTLFKYPSSFNFQFSYLLNVLLFL